MGLSAFRCTPGVRISNGQRALHFLGPTVLETGATAPEEAAVLVRRGLEP